MPHTPLLDALPPPSMAAYLLDFDGTLVDIAPAPNLVRVAPGLPETLRRLRMLCGQAVAIVSGRPVAEVDAYLPNAAYAVAGEHGTALRPAPAAPIVVMDLPPPPNAWLTDMAELVGSHPGALLEPKAHGFAVHYRGAPAAGAVLRDALAEMLAEAPGRYELLSAKMAWEVRPRGVDKGSAVRALMRAAPFAGRLPVFVGDDVTDEDGIEAARAMGGAGLRVGEAFADPAGVRAWLGWLVAEG